MVAAFGGRIIDTAGDGILAEFASVVNAVECALAIQKAMGERNAAVEQTRRMQFRIGVNLGDVIFDETRIYGDGINIAARLEGISEPGGICISEKVYDEIRDKVSATFEDKGPQELKNIARPVRAYACRTGGPAAVQAGRARGALALPDKPSIAVLPFTNFIGDPEQEYFVDGMVEEITTALSRIRWLFVIARNSSFTYKGRAVDVTQVGRELGVRYVLEGSVRKAGTRVRITGQLIDATTRSHLWADNFDGSLENIFELQDNVASRVAGVIEPVLHAAERTRATQRPTNDLTAYDLYLRALAECIKWERSSTERGLALLEQTLRKDPNYGSALALAALCHVYLYTNMWTSDLEAARQRGLDLAQAALHANGDDPYVLAYAAYTLGFFLPNIDVALDLIDRCLQLNPNYAQGWVRSGWLRLWAGQGDLAIQHFETYRRLDPRESGAVANFGVGIAHFFARRFDQAETRFRLSLQERSGWAPTYRFLASCYAHMGQLHEAKDVMKRLRAVTTNINPDVHHWRVRADRELLLEGFHLAASQ